MGRYLLLVLALLALRLALKGIEEAHGILHVQTIL